MQRTPAFLHFIAWHVVTVDDFGIVSLAANIGFSIGGLPITNIESLRKAYMRTHLQTFAAPVNFKFSVLTTLIATLLLTSSAYALTADSADTALPELKSLSAQCELSMKTMPGIAPGTVLLAARKGS